MSYFHFFTHDAHFYFGLPRWLSNKEFACQCRRCNRHMFDPWVRKIPWGNGHLLQYSCLENPIFTLSDTYFFPYEKRSWDLRLFKESVIFLLLRFFIDGGNLVTKSCLILCDPIDCSPPGFSVHGTSQARLLEWVAISYSRRSCRPRDRTCVFCLADRFFITELRRKPSSVNNGI